MGQKLKMSNGEKVKRSKRQNIKRLIGKANLQPLSEHIYPITQAQEHLLKYHLS